MKRMRTLVAVLALVVSGCSTPAGTLFRTTIAQPDGSYPMPVALGDVTGLVTGIEPADGDSAVGIDKPSVQPDPSDPSAVIVTFVTGACDDDTAVSFDRSGTAFSLLVDVNSGFDFACSAQALFRGFRIRFSEPVPADSIVASSART